jgi:hypothetical protein
MSKHEAVSSHEYKNDFSSIIIRPVPGGRRWYHENLLIENASETFLQELMRFSVMGLVRKVLLVCIPDLKLPHEFPDPGALQKYIESL